MSAKKNKSKRRTVPRGWGRVVVVGSEPKMSEIILELADPLIDGDVSNAKVVDLIVQVTIAAWNKAMLSADRQDAIGKADHRYPCASGWRCRTGRNGHPGDGHR